VRFDRCFLLQFRLGPYYVISSLFHCRFIRILLFLNRTTIYTSSFLILFPLPSLCSIYYILSLFDSFPLIYFSSLFLLLLFCVANVPQSMPCIITSSIKYLFYRMRSFTIIVTCFDLIGHQQARLYDPSTYKPTDINTVMRFLL
jgi:hypothetical protein